MGDGSVDCLETMDGFDGVCVCPNDDVRPAITVKVEFLIVLFDLAV